MADKKRNTLVYLVYSDRVIDDSPKNSVTAVPVPPNQPAYAGRSPFSSEVSLMQPTRPLSLAARRWRIALPVWLGVILLLASIGIAALSLRSHAGDSSSFSPAATTPGDDNPWMSLGYVDIEGGVTPLYPLQPGRVKRIEAVENEPMPSNAPLLHLDDAVPALKVRLAKIDLDAAKEQLALAEAKLKPFEEQVAAQKEAVTAAGIKVKRAQNRLDTERGFLKKDAGGSPETVKDAELQVQEAKVGVQAEQKKLAALEAGRAQLEGASRAGHFAAVLTVVAKLFGIVGPDRALFGEKDYQQLVLVQRMVADLRMDVQILGIPTVREVDGLALSSRNVHLDAEARSAAVALSAALHAGAQAGSQGHDAVLAAADEVLARQPAVELDYLALRNPQLGPAPRQGPARLLLAATVGTTRLIDNVGLQLAADSNGQGAP